MKILAHCIFCGNCEYVCPQHAVYEGEDRYHIDHDRCNDCGVCEDMCPVKNIRYDE